MTAPDHNPSTPEGKNANRPSLGYRSLQPAYQLPTATETGSATQSGVGLLGCFGASIEHLVDETVGDRILTAQEAISLGVIGDALDRLPGVT